MGGTVPLALIGSPVGSWGSLRLAGDAHQPMTVPLACPRAALQLQGLGGRWPSARCPSSRMALALLLLPGLVSTFRGQRQPLAHFHKERKVSPGVPGKFLLFLIGQCGISLAAPGSNPRSGKRAFSAGFLPKQCPDLAGGPLSVDTSFSRKHGVVWPGCLTSRHGVELGLACGSGSFSLCLWTFSGEKARQWGQPGQVRSL